MNELNHLDEDQLKAVKYLDNALVIAGAGSGKTTTIIAKINYLLKNNYYKKEEILVISFTNESVKSIKERLEEEIAVKTFHKLAVDLIENKNLTICKEDYLDYIINEFFCSYALSDKKTKERMKRLLKETTLGNIKILVKTFINLYKSNYQTNDFLFYLYKHNHFKNKDYLTIILIVYQLYLRELEASGMLDFNDLIIYATNLIKNNTISTNYKLVIIDEFQDTSAIRFELIQSILKANNGKLFAVGDDYQSIYRFSGCDLGIFLNINKYLPNIQMLFLNHNYRNPLNLVEVANEFILRNKRQIKKNTICHKNVDKPLVFHFYREVTQVFRTIQKLDGKILVLGRNNRDRERFGIVEDERIRFLTIHRAKGLEEENVVLINLDNHLLGFPSQIKNEVLITKVLKQDYVMHEEERRLMYVALTRTKNKVYLFVPKDNYSIFIKELISNYKKLIEIKFL